MKKILKLLFGIVVLAAVVYFGYQAYQKWFKPADFSVTAQDVQKQGTEALNNAKNSVVAGAQSVITKNLSDLAKWAGQNLYSLGEAIVGIPSSSSLPGASPAPAAPAQFFNNQVIAAPSSAAGNFSVPPPTVSIMTGVNQQISFSLISDGAYEIQWGDGSVEDGTGKGLGNVTVVAHSWTKPGDYTVQVKTTSSGSNVSYSFPIRVLE